MTSRRDHERAPGAPRPYELYEMFGDDWREYMPWRWRVARAIRNLWPYGLLALWLIATFLLIFTPSA